VSEPVSAAPPLPWWRIVAGSAVLLLLLVFAVRLLPLYLHNYELQQFVEVTTRNAENQTASDDLLRTRVVEKATQLELPVTVDNVLIKHAAGGVRIDVRYAVRVDLPLYTVRLHFYPGAGSRPGL
jgi:hypothetical protein